MTIGHDFGDISPGDTAQTARVVTPDDLSVFAHVSGHRGGLVAMDKAISPSAAKAKGLKSLMAVLYAPWQAGGVSAVATP
jgi:hypothetical protein